MDETRHRRRGRPFDTVYIAYWSLRDPLLLSQSLPVLRELAGRGRRVGLLTYEQERWRLSPPEAQKAREELAGQGITWLAAPYHGRPAVVSTLFDIVLGTLRCWRVARAPGVRMFHGRGTVAAAVAGLASRLSGARFLNDADGPLSQEYVDALIWRKGSLPERITRWSEERCLRRADAVAVLTERRREAVEPLARNPVTVLPCAVDLDHFVARPEVARNIREESGLSGVVLVYAGKTGGWYLTEPMLDFVATYRETVGETTLLVLTPEEPEQFLEPCRRRGLPCVVRRATREEMPLYLSAADAGLSFRLSAPSQSACSPVKNGEYLACGLPVVTTTGIGDYSKLIAQERVGVVVTALDSAGMQRAATALAALLKDASLAQRCRDTARDAVGFREVVLPRYLEIYERLLTRPAGRGI